MSHQTEQTKASLSDEQKAVLSAVARFGPVEKRELSMLVPECKSYEVDSKLSELKRRGFITLEDESKREYDRIEDGDVIKINTDPFNLPKEGQSSLTGDEPDPSEVIAANLPEGVETDSSVTLELTPEQTKLFEKMRTNVSRECGEMDREEFMDWVLREARRMTEV